MHMELYIPWKWAIFSCRSDTPVCPLVLPAPTSSPSFGVSQAVFSAVNLTKKKKNQCKSGLITGCTTSIMSFFLSKVNSLNFSWGACVLFTAVCQSKSPSKSPQKSQTTRSPSLQRIHKQEASSVSCDFAQNCSWHRLWVNKYSVWQENWHIKLQPQDVRRPPLTLSLVFTFVSWHLLLSQTPSCHLCLFSKAAKFYLICLVSTFIHSFSICASLTSCVHLCSHLVKPSWELNRKFSTRTMPYT